MQSTDIQFHIHCKPGDIGRYVILVGDPARVEKVAALYDNACFIAENREFKTFTGELCGRKVSVCSTGIGGPSAAIAMEELHNLGADTFIRCGTCGGIDTDVRPGDIVVATAAVRFEHTSLEYAPSEFPAVSDFDIAFALKKAALSFGLPVHMGIVQSKDSFYGQHTPEKSPVSYELLQKWEAWKRLHVKASEMETAALFTVAAALGVRCGACFHVMWNQEREKLGYVDNVSASVDAAVKTAAAALKSVIISDMEG